MSATDCMDLYVNCLNWYTLISLLIIIILCTVASYAFSICYWYIYIFIEHGKNPIERRKL